MSSQSVKGSNTFNQSVKSSVKGSVKGATRKWKTKVTSILSDILHFIYFTSLQMNYRIKKYYQTNHPHKKKISFLSPLSKSDKQSEFQLML